MKKMNLRLIMSGILFMHAGCAWRSRTEQPSLEEHRTIAVRSEAGRQLTLNLRLGLLGN